MAVCHAITFFGFLANFKGHHRAYSNQESFERIYTNLLQLQSCGRLKSMAFHYENERLAEIQDGFRLSNTWLFLLILRDCIAQKVTRNHLMESTLTCYNFES